jgi:hypothetical protein
MRRALVAMALALALVPSAAAVESTIYPGVGIGKVKLGMAKAQVVHVLGHEYIVNGRSSNSVELAWNFASWSVTFVGNRAAQVAVSVSSQKTAAGVGPGSSWSVHWRCRAAARAGGVSPPAQGRDADDLRAATTGVRIRRHQSAGPVACQRGARADAFHSPPRIRTGLAVPLPEGLENRR